MITPSAPRNCSRNVRIIAISCAVTVLIVLLGSGQSSQRRAGDVVRDGVRYRDVQFGDTIYRLPVDKYRIGITPFDKERDYAAFIFDAVAPDLTPPSDDPEEVAKWGKGKGRFRNLHGLVEYGWNVQTQQKQLEDSFEDSRRFRSHIERWSKDPQSVLRKLKFLDPNVYSTLPSGCRRYEGYFLTGNVIQVCENGDGEHMLVVSCDLGDARGRVPSPSCKVTINIAARTRLTYSYSYEYFDSALEVHRKLISLLNSFRIHPVSQREL